MKIKYEWFTYVTLCGLLLISAFAGFVGLSPQSDALIISLASVLAVYTIAVLLVGHIHRMRKFRFGPTGVEVENFRDLQQQALDAKEDEAPPEVKREIEEIKMSDKHIYGVFLTLVGEIERKLRLIAEAKDFSGFQYKPVARLIADLERKEVLSEKLGDLIRNFWQIRNQVVHGAIRLDADDLTSAISVGEIIITDLDKTYRKMKAAQESRPKT